ncbi:DUF4124 domain-containing protein [Ketobacter sp. MCCC 1A13808]|uniref:DUF4124 domain-containing protein n=1 Tax=Ketobacter sp. MCCC 1A13808 TaxID=2602738 RepID=UPI000F14B3F2|nr:DUF4124 domain-containing protein [Ketobacter sp. MCCC 1A13808]MVF14763.1 DUF4124 domain-containing protein [Ketobacter sp. MCCC 1A13808]RLP52667.1 MAG: DUF4124 domain-containing protein [Ketobacter sp.]
MIKQRFLLPVAILATMMLASPLHAAKFFKWVDDQGVTHYGENPPDTETAQTINVKSGASSDQQQAVDNLEAMRKSSSETKELSREDKNAEIERRNKAIMAQNCKDQQRNLGQLKANRRVKETGTDGEIRFLDEAEIASRIKEIQTYMAENCTGM